MNGIKRIITRIASMAIIMSLTLSLAACVDNENKNESSAATYELSSGTPEASTPEPTEIPVTHIEKLNPDLLPQFLPMEEGEDIAVIATSEGEIRMRFFPEFAPFAVENFLTLAGDEYYKDMIFHRVIKQFMIQTGDPLGTGTGGSSKWGEGFVTESTTYLHFFRGAVGMARSEDYYSNGSQFFIVQNNMLDEGWINLFEEYKEAQEDSIDGTDAQLKDFYPMVVLDRFIEEGGAPHLDFDYTVFGQVYEGMDVVDKIAEAETNADDKPLTDIQLISITIEKYTK